MNKVCQKCQIEKPLDLFALGKKYVGGRRGTCKDCHAGTQRNYYYSNPEKMKEKEKSRENWKKHRLTKDTFDELIFKFNGKCHACKTNSATSIDHDHSCCSGSYSCGKCVRGILCHNCNSSLGLLKDSRQNIIGLLQYIDS